MSDLFNVQGEPVCIVCLLETMPNSSTSVTKVWTYDDACATLDADDHNPGRFVGDFLDACIYCGEKATFNRESVA